MKENFVTDVRCSGCNVRPPSEDVDDTITNILNLLKPQFFFEFYEPPYPLCQAVMAVLTTTCYVMMGVL